MKEGKERVGEREKNRKNLRKLRPSWLLSIS
jgi:hypothetical protein